jgi:hypothetical protein
MHQRGWKSKPKTKTNGAKRENEKGTYISAASVGGGGARSRLILAARAISATLHH